MSKSELTEYETARIFSDENQIKAAAAIPIKLQAKEERFFDKMSHTKVGSLRKLEMLYSLMDELSISLSKFMPCKKGCAFCCHYKISISEIEVAYIEKHTKHRRLKKMTSWQDFHGHACPFLKENVCSIYAVRPFACRRHNALTKDAFWCNHEHSDRAFPLIRFTNVDRVFDLIRLEANASEHSDIRQFFGSRVGI